MGWEAATVTVNGSSYIGYDITAGGCSAESGAWVVGVPLQMGANTIDAEVCDFWGNCGYASTIVYRDSPMGYAVSITPDSGSTTATEDAASVVNFTISNTGDVGGTLNGSVSCTGALYDCIVPFATTFTAYLALGDSISMPADFSTSEGATGTV
jgi:hypothetical protein